MSKEKIKKITLEDFIAKKEQSMRDKHNPKTNDLYIKSLDGYITVAEPMMAQLADARKFAEDSEESGNAYIVYQCVIDPNLKAAELSNNAIRHEIVYDIFKPGEVQYIAAHLMKMAGYDSDSVTLTEKIKN